MKIYQKYILKEFLSFFLFFLLCFYGLYVLIDYAGHAQTFYSSKNFSWDSFFRYYGAMFLVRAEILVPVGLLLAFLKTILRFNRQGEMVAFLAGGLSVHRLLRPLFLCGWAALLLLYMNEEWWLPVAGQKVSHIEESGKKNRKKRAFSATTVESVGFKDGSLLFYLAYDPVSHALSDVFWIDSLEDVYHMQSLFPWRNPPKAILVDHFVRSASGELLFQGRWEERSFPEIPFQKDRLQSTLLDPDMQPLSSLWEQFKSPMFEEASDRRGRLESAFAWKMLIPWFCLLALLLPAPACLRFSRQLPLFLLYARPLFTLLALYLFLDALKTVTSRQILPPVPTLVVPLMMSLLWTWMRYRRVAF